MHGQKALSRPSSLTRTILALAWPAVATNVTTPLLSLVDVAVVGHIGNSVYIGAIAVGAVMFNMLYWLMGFLRMGTSGMTAQAYGAGDSAECVRTLARAMLIALLAGTLMIALSPSLGTHILNFIDADSAAREPARQYFSVAILGAPGLLMTYALSGWFLGMQTSRPILWMALVANTLNIILNLAFVYGLGWDVRGVGAATAISQWVSAATGILLLSRRLRRITATGWRHGLLQMRALRHFFAINTDIFLRTLCLVAVTVWFTHAGATMGVDTLSANAIIMQLFILFSYLMDGFAFAGEALAGKFHGARDTAGLHRLVRVLMRIGLAAAALVTVIYYLCGEGIMRLLTRASCAPPLTTASGPSPSPLPASCPSCGTASTSASPAPAACSCPWPPPCASSTSAGSPSPAPSATMPYGSPSSSTSSPAASSKPTSSASIRPTNPQTYPLFYECFFENHR